MKSNLVMFSGYAKLPGGITSSEMYKVIGITTLIDITSGEIIEADCTLATGLARRHVSNIITGHSLEEGFEPLLKKIENLYQGSAKKAIITALRIIHDKYRMYKDGHRDFGSIND